MATSFPGSLCYPSLRGMLCCRYPQRSAGFQGRKTFCPSFCASLIAGSRLAFLCVDRVCLSRSVRVLTETEWNTRGAKGTWENRRFICKAVFVCFVVVVVSSLENYCGFRTTNVKGKTDHSVSLRWNKTLWTFPKRRVFRAFDLRVDFVAFIHLAELKLSLYKGILFLCPQWGSRAYIFRNFLTWTHFVNASWIKLELRMDVSSTTQRN